MAKEIKPIGSNRYAFLQVFKESELTEEQVDQMIDFEQKRGIKRDTEEQNKEQKEYFENLNKVVTDFKLSIEYPSLYKLFRAKFKENNGVKFSETPQDIENIKPLVFYFSKDPKFFECKNLITEFNFGGSIKKVEPSFDKGILLVGGTGNGKTTVLEAFCDVFKPYKDFNYSMFNIKHIVEMFESCDTNQDKANFWQLMNRNRICLDDLKSERNANNFGKVNLGEEIQEKRYSNKLKTFATCNYSNEEPGDIDMAVFEFLELYGKRVFSRLFKMYNIIHFKGGDKRK